MILYSTAGLQTLFIKDQLANILIFVVYMISVANVQLCYSSEKGAMGST